MNRRPGGRRLLILVGVVIASIVAAITLVLGTGDFTLKFGGFALGGIGTATFGAILLYALLNRGGEPASRAAGQKSA